MATERSPLLHHASYDHASVTSPLYEQDIEYGTNASAGTGASAQHETGDLQSRNVRPTGATMSSQTSVEAIIAAPPELPRATFWLCFIGVVMGQFVIWMDSSIMYSSYPVVTSYFQSANAASWLTTSFMLTAISFQSLFGRFSDITGRKLPYMLCLTVVILATLWCAMAQDMVSFILARAMCGLGAGGVITLVAVITGDIVPVEKRAPYLATGNLVYGLGCATGAAAGGFISEHLGWRWMFWLQLPCLVLCLIAASAMPNDLGKLHGSKKLTIRDVMGKFDWKGSMLLAMLLSLVVLVLSLGGNLLAWSHPLILCSLMIILLGIPPFILTEKSARLPVMPLRLFTQQPFAGAILGDALARSVHTIVIFNAPLYFQSVLLETPTSSGLRLLAPMALSSVSGVITAVYLTYHRRLGPPLIGGAIAFGLGSLSLLAINRHVANWLFYVILSLPNISLGFINPSSILVVLAAASYEDQAVTASALYLCRSIGNIAGVALSSFVFQTTLQRYLTHYVHGPARREVIATARRSVSAIRHLAQPYRDQVVESYDHALWLVFLLGAVLGVGCMLLLVSVRVPKLAGGG